MTGNVRTEAHRGERGEGCDLPFQVAPAQPPSEVQWHPEPQWLLVGASRALRRAVHAPGSRSVVCGRPSPCHRRRERGQQRKPTMCRRVTRCTSGRYRSGLVLRRARNQPTKSRKEHGRFQEGGLACHDQHRERRGLSRGRKWRPGKNCQRGSSRLGWAQRCLSSRSRSKQQEHGGGEQGQEQEQQQKQQQEKQPESSRGATPGTNEEG